ncbi:TIGR02266 family protein [Corallococcus caeni]|uniref:TIGR02266 family protein n=1 Tax=Corallococcus caeni TaxID=3082388 RepID=A0ABQ6R0D1_9BACT|nr:hypothetical protein ASNO1_59400 [Corallococcus sp. NO1]
MTGPAPKLLPLRIRLPYTEEEEFIERYGSNVGRGGVFVATKALKPEGTGLAFEFVLADGTRLLRGEGVVAKAQPDGGSPRTGMTVRFTKLDAVSKALIERIVARRSGTEAVASPPAAPRTEAAPLPPGLVRRTPAVNPSRPAARVGTEAVPATPAPLEPPASASREEPEARAATPKASMTLPAVSVPAAVAAPDLAEPDEPVSLFPEEPVDEEEALAPLPEVGLSRKARRNPPGEGAQRATQEMFTVQPTVPEPTVARPPAASGTFAAVMPPPVEAGWEGAGPAEPPADPPPLESSGGAGEAGTDAPSWEAAGTAEALGTNALSGSAAADEVRAEASSWEEPSTGIANVAAESFGDAEASAWDSNPDAATASEGDDGRAEAASWEQAPTEARSAASEWESSGPEARTDEALPRETGATESPDEGDASAPVHFTPASVEAFDPNAVLGAPHAPEHSEWAPEASPEEPGDRAFAGTPGEAEPERVEAATTPDASFDFDVDLSMEPEEEPTPAVSGSSFEPALNPAEGDADATLPPEEHGAWAAPGSDAGGLAAETTPHEGELRSWEAADVGSEEVATEAALPLEARDSSAALNSGADGVDAEATPPPVEPFSAAPDAEAMGGSEEALPPREPVATPNQREADRLRAWGIDPDSLPHEFSTASEDVDPFSAALEQAVEATAPASSEDVSESLADEPGYGPDTEPVLGSPAFTTSAAEPTADQDLAPGSGSAPPQEEEESSTVVVVELPTEDAWTALVGSAAPAPANDPPPAEAEKPFAADAALADGASPESERAWVRTTEDEAALSAASPTAFAPDEVSSVVATPDEAEARSTSAKVPSSESLEETLSASPVAPATGSHEEASPQSVSTTAVPDSSTAHASNTKPSVEGFPSATAALHVPDGTSASPVIESQPVPEEATQPAAAREPGANEAATPASAGSEQLPARASTTTESPSADEVAAPHSTASESLPSQAPVSTRSPSAEEAAASISTAPSQPRTAEQLSRATEATVPVSPASSQPLATEQSSHVSEATAPLGTALPQPPGTEQPSQVGEATAPTRTDPLQLLTEVFLSRVGEATAASNTASSQPLPTEQASRISETAVPSSPASSQPLATEQASRISETTSPSSPASSQPLATEQASRASATTAPSSPASSQPLATEQASRISETAAPSNTASSQPSATEQASRINETAVPSSPASSQPLATEQTSRISETAAPSNTASSQPPATEQPSRISEATAPASPASSQSSAATQAPRADEAAPPPAADAPSSTATARSRRRTLFDLTPVVPVTTPAAAEVVLGIDVGTSHARVAALINGVATPIPIPGTDGAGIPSVIAVASSGELQVGAAALVEAARAPRRAAVGLKRLLGVRARSPNLRWLSPQLPFPIATDLHGDAGVELGGRIVAPTLLTAMLLRELREAATTFLGRKVTRAVLCAPSHFTERQRAALREAATMAGLDVPRVLTNSAAAALAYAHGRGLARKRVLVVDLGGGGLEVCVVQVTGDDLEVVTTGGDPTLGGMDFDGRIAEALVSDLSEQGHPRPEHLLDWGPLRTLAESTKETLSTKDSVDVTLPSGPGPTLDRERVEALTADLAQRVVSVTREVLESNALSPQGLDAVLLVGGQSRAPLVRRRLEESLGVPVRDDDVDARTAVVRGAALLGHALLLSETGKPAASVSEVLTAPIGVAEDAGTFRRVLERNTRLPTAKTLVIPVTAPGPLALALFQGTAATAVENEWLGALTLTVERPGEVEVHLELSTDGTLAFSATLPGAKRQPVVLATEDLDDASREALIARSPFHTEPEARPSGLLSGLKKLFGRR